MTLRSGTAALVGFLLVSLLTWPALPAAADEPVSPSQSPSASESATPPPAPTPPPTPTPTPTPGPDCRGSKDTRTRSARKVPFTVCAVVVISKAHRVTAKYLPSVVRVQIRKQGIATVRLQATAGSALKKLFTTAGKAGYRLAVRSAYRSYATQKAIYRPGMTLTAPPGASEHQSGLAADLAAIGRSGVIRGYAFGRSNAGKWVAKHAAKFGFVVRYPKGRAKITKIPYEPWHLRYLGSALAASVVATPTKTVERYLWIS